MNRIRKENLTSHRWVSSDSAVGLAAVSYTSDVGANVKDVASLP